MATDSPDDKIQQVLKSMVETLKGLDRKEENYGSTESLATGFITYFKFNWEWTMNFRVAEGLVFLILGLIICAFVGDAVYSNIWSDLGVMLAVIGALQLICLCKGYAYKKIRTSTESDLEYLAFRIGYISGLLLAQKGNNNNNLSKKK